MEAIMAMVCIKNRVIGLLALVFLFSLYPQAGFCGTPPKQGENLPEIGLAVPDSEKDKAYLGIKGKDRFSIKDIDAQLIVLEILGVYCPVCHKQRPHINRLFYRVNKNADLSGKVKFLGIAAGSPSMEVDYYVKQSKVPYPVLPDEKFVIHKSMAEPRTPYTMVVTKNGKIVYAHLGLIEDMNKFFVTLKELAGKALPISK
jgi:hypothetical protein